MNILIIGACSKIAEEFGKLYADKDNSLFLVARDIDKLNSVKTNLEVIGVKEVKTLISDFSKTSKLKELISELSIKNFDIILIAHGTLPDEQKAKDNFSYFLKSIKVNFISTSEILNKLKTKVSPKGTIAVITSVAGDRGRASNYVYGASKAALSTYISGLRSELSGKVNILDIKPGFVDTPMTADIDKNFLFAKPEKIAQGIKKAIDKNKNSSIYLPFYWQFIMLIIKLIPNFIFKKLKF